MTVSAKTGFTLLDEGTSLAGSVMDMNIARYGASLICVSRTTSVPGSPQEGQAFLIGPTSTWPGGHIGDIAVWSGGAWSYIVPYAGLSTYVVSMKSTAIFYAEYWQFPEANAGAASVLASGTTNMYFTNGCTEAWQFNTSGTRTLNIDYGAYGYIPGVIYTWDFFNNTGSAITVALSGTYWIFGANYTVSPNKHAIIQFVSSIDDGAIVINYVDLVSPV